MTISDMEALLKKTIPQIQQRLRDLDKIEKVGVEEMKNFIRLEKLSKRRSGIIGWLTVGIMQGKLPSEFYLDYQAKTGIYKSAVQKYIRRGNVGKAVRAAKVLYSLNKQQAIRRLKIIIVEDAFSAVETLKFFDDNMGPQEFLGVVSAVALAPKDKSLCHFSWELVEGSLTQKVTEAVTDVEWLKANLLNKEEYQQVVVQLFKLCKIKRFADIYEVFHYDTEPVVKACLDRVAGGTFWESDSALLLMAAIRFKQKDYLLKDLQLPPIDESEVEPLPLTKLDWYAFDFHTSVGKVAERFFLSKHPNISQKTLRNVWFRAESARLGGEVISDLMEPFDRELWEKIKDEIRQTVESVMLKFEFAKIEERESSKWQAL